MSEAFERFLQKRVILFTVPWQRDVRAIVDFFNSLPTRPRGKMVELVHVDAYESPDAAASEGVSTFPSLIVRGKLGERVIALSSEPEKCTREILRVINLL